MGLSIWHVVVVLVVVLILFGAGKLPQVMGDVAKGIKNFKSGLADDGDKTPAPVPQEAVAQAPASIVHHVSPATGAGVATGNAAASAGKS